MQSPDIAAGRWLRLSHVLTATTPAYGGGIGLVVEPTRMMCRGDSCNTASLSLSNHLGSHVDAPRHFVADGRTVDSYTVADWIFVHPWVLDVPAEPGEVLGVEKFAPALEGCTDADLLLVRTGFEKWRGEERYWASSPAFDPGLVDYLRARLPGFSAIGLDTISIGSLLHRQLGRSAHQRFLGAGLRIFEDLSLAGAPAKDRLACVIALPLYIDEADGAPCTVIGQI